MRYLTLLVFIGLVACSPAEQEETTLQSSVNVDLSVVPALLTALDEMTDSQLDVSGLTDLTNNVTIDQEDQRKFAVTYKGEETELLYHVWREQSDWVHLYFSTPSKALHEAMEASNAAFARTE